MAGPGNPTLEMLSASECFEYLRGARIGRVALSVDALPIVLPVSFALRGNDIVFRAAIDAKLSAATSGTVVAFEADGCDADGATSWSVVAQGVASAVVDRVELDGIEAILDNGSSSDAPCTRVVRVRAGHISGIRMARQQANRDSGHWIASLHEGHR